MTAHLLRVLQLASPALPVGGFSYSQGLEAAVEAGSVGDAATAQRWIGDLLTEVMPHGELAVLARLLRALPDDVAGFVAWNDWFRAARDTRELHAESVQMGAALIAWMRDLVPGDAALRACVARAAPITWPGAWALACHADAIPADDALTAYQFAWLESQVLAAMKLVPLGQVAGQRMLRALAGHVPASVAQAARVDDAGIASFAPGLALASMRHESQYTRLFRS